MPQNFYSPGSIICIKDYKFPNGEIRDKYLIVLYHKDGEAFIIRALTTSNTKRLDPTKQLFSGCNKHGAINFYHYPKDKILDFGNSFAFRKDTFIFFSNNVVKESILDLEKYKDPNNDLKFYKYAQINNFDFKRLLKCINKSGLVERGIKKVLTEFKATLK